MEIVEPVTMLTDYALAGITSLFAGLLLRAGGLRLQKSVRLWAGAFMMTAVASIVGGTYHGFSRLIEETTALTLWRVVVLAVGLVSLFVLSGAIVASVRRPIRQWLLAAATLKFLLYAVWMATHTDFRYVIYDYASSLLCVLVLQGWAGYMQRQKSSAWIVGGVLVSFAAAGIQQSRLTLHENFNHNDLYHLIQMGAFYLLYRGGRLLKDR